MKPRGIFTFIFVIILFLLVPIIMFPPVYTYAKGKTGKNPISKEFWEKQLHEMNYLIMKTSTVNIINALALTLDQKKHLKIFQKEISATAPAIPDMKAEGSQDLIEIRIVYIKLLKYLINKESIPEDLKNLVSKMRLLESDIIKKSLLGASSPGYTGSGCLQCHAPPDKFSKGDISRLKTAKITEEKRKIVDKAHVIGIFGQQGTHKLWVLKSDVFNLLTDYQKLLLKDFQCCLMPSKNLMDGALAGQAFVTDEWINYFRSIRDVGWETWPDVKHLYVIPIEDLIEATLPGITSTDKKKILKRVNRIIEDARRMDDVTFEIQKNALCLRLKDELTLDALKSEKKAVDEHQAFRAAMFLLLPGISDLY